MKALFICLIGVFTPCFAELYKIASPVEVENRVAEAKNRLSQSEGGKLLWESIEAHGGLNRWYSNGLLEFRWIYNMTDRGLIRDSTQIIDTWSSKARHEVHGQKEKVTFGWNGEKAWITPVDTKLITPADFWALTPYYFVGVPHVLADPGTIHEKLDAQIDYKGEKFDQVKVSYQAGTGSTPDDYYIVLIHPTTKQVKGVRYIVTDQRITKGKKSTPEKLLTYEGWYEISGVLFPKSHATHKMNGNIIGEAIRSATVSEAKFLGAIEVSFDF